mmetsp:Transcript_59458/g.88283  ORF Transcript_59458/g.88283 Transcript_59458/m.88283 type:complete len:94 (-) Transcript_59458:12-293(-)
MRYGNKIGHILNSKYVIRIELTNSLLQKSFHEKNRMEPGQENSFSRASLCFCFGQTKSELALLRKKKGWKVQQEPTTETSEQWAVHKFGWSVC